MLGILGTAIYEMISGAIVQFVGSFWETWAKAAGALVVVGVFQYGRTRRKARRAKLHPPKSNSEKSELEPPSR
jgi:hypothetical protein